MNPKLVSLLLLTSIGSLAQDEARPILQCDGHPLESYSVEGFAEHRHDAGSVQQGLASLAVRPDPSRDYLGVTVFRVAANAPKRFRCRLRHAGDSPARYRIRWDDAASKDQGYATSFHDCPPGWSVLEVDLASLRTPKGRVLDASRGLSRIQISIRRGPDVAEGFILDGLELLGEATIDARSFLRRLEPLVDAERRAVIQSEAPFLARSELGSTLVSLLTKEHDEECRELLRHLLIAADPELVSDAVEQAWTRSRDVSVRVELAYIFASLASPTTWAKAVTRARESQRSGLERTALLVGLARAGRDEFAAAEPGPKWPLEAAYAQGLRRVGTAASVDRLIGLLGAATTSRGRADAEESLIFLTGADLGANPTAWKDYFSARRAEFRPHRGLEPAPRAYGSFFGLPVRPGRATFVLDLSGSMRDPVRGGRAAEHIARSPHLAASPPKTRLELAKAELANAVGGLGRESTVRVLVYNDEVLALTKGHEAVTDEQKRKLLRRISTLEAGQKTNIHDGLLEAFIAGRGPLSEEDWAIGPETIYLLTDGNPSVGPIVRRQALDAAVARWNLGRMIEIHAVNVGDTDARLLRSLAARSGGRFLDLSSDSSQEEPR